MSTEKHSSIITEILDFRKAELCAGRTPTKINLSVDQLSRLKSWCNLTDSICVAPDGTERVNHVIRFKDGVIFGMRFKAPAQLPTT